VRIRWSEPAEFDLDDLFDYIARDAPAYAERFIDQIVDAVAKLRELSTRLSGTGDMLMASHHHRIIAVTPADKAFYQALGQRIAERRKAQDLTQQHLAERLGVSQQTLAHYEVGRLRIAVAMFSTLAKELDVAVEDLLGEPAKAGKAGKAGKNKRGPTPKLQQQLEQISQLPRAKQRFVIQMLDTVLQQTG